MTSEMILTVWTVIPGSDSLKISFGNSPIVCKTTAFLPSLVKKTKKSDRQLSNIHHNQHSEQKKWRSRKAYSHCSLSQNYLWPAVGYRTANTAEKQINIYSRVNAV